MKFLKTHFNKIIALLMLLALPMVARAYNFIADGLCYNYNNDGTSVTVTYGVEYTGAINIPESVSYNGTTYSVTTIGHDAFARCTGLTSIKSKILNPDKVTMYSGVFSGINKSNCSLFVPQGTKDVYQATPQWSDFVNIVEVPFAPGDVNYDDECTGSDVTALYNFILYNDSSAIVNGDQNGDGVVTGSDVTAVYNIILGL